MAQRNPLYLWALLSLAFAAGLAAAIFWTGQRQSGPIALATGTYLEPGRAIEAFRLTDAQGHSFTREQLLGKWSVLFFGYTSCPDVCPTRMTLLAALTKKMRATDPKPLPQIIFVSVDRQRDTPAQLAQYLKFFDPDFIGLTATDEAGLQALTRDLGVAYAIRKRPDGGYDVDHSGALFVVSPDLKLRAILTGPFAPDTLRQDLLRITAGAP
jgi:protein SCO1/2